MNRIFVSLGSLLVSAAILLAGGGLHGTLVSVRANLEGFPLETIGLIMAAYYAGFVFGCFGAPRMVAQVGHIRTFTGLAAVLAACSLIFAILPDAWLWMALRGVVGYCFAGLYTIIESWINERSTNDNRGQVLSIYRAVDLIAMTVGQYLLLLADPGGFILFSIVAILIALSIVPVALTPIESPAIPAQVKLRPGALWKVSPLAVAGCAAVGITNGAFYTMSPIFVQRLGYDTTTVALFMSAVIMAGGLAQYPIGYLSDLVDRRKVLLMAAVGASVSGGLLAAFADFSLAALLAGGAAYGVFAMVLFGLSAAHANDHADNADFVVLSGGLLLIYGFASIIGPLLVPLVMDSFGPGALFAVTAAIHGALVLFTLYRMAVREAVPVADQEQYILTKPTTPSAFEIDPRSAD